MTAGLRWAAVALLMAVSILLGWRANITFEPNPVHYVPVPVRDTLAYYHWYLAGR